MLDIGWSELLVVGVVALIVIGPRELPTALHTLGRWVARARATVREFQAGIDDMARETEAAKLRQEILDVDRAAREEPRSRPTARVAPPAETEEPEALADEEFGRLEDEERRADEAAAADVAGSDAAAADAAGSDAAAADAAGSDAAESGEAAREGSADEGGKPAR